jgi:transcriptional regulator with XRE-family HTH domain
MVNNTHHSEKPTNHPLRIWRKSQEPRVALEVLAETLGCTRAHLSMIEHYKLMPSYALTLKLSMLTGISMEDMAPPHKAQEARKDVRERFAVAIKNRDTRQADRKRAA